jgi:hypothetical protein
MIKVDDKAKVEDKAKVRIKVEDKVKVKAEEPRTLGYQGRT